MAVLPFIWKILLPINMGLNPILNTTLGPIKGNWELSSNNIAYMAFTGIPFAKPPVGQLRFANPEPADAWTGTLDATKRAPRCAQRNYLFYDNPKVEGQEDCLYLNIYVPVMNMYEIGARISTETVMAGIHWGGFMAGGSDAGYLGPSYFMNKGVILVTFNYRLGIFGFLSTLDDAAPGNLGLKDQVLALKWIKQNINSYGGNPEKVTIFGQSAGAASVHFHLASKASDGLFARAISQSGSALASWALPNNTLQYALTMTDASIFNCHHSTSYALVHCMRNVSVDELLWSQDNFKIFHRFPLSVWGTVVETSTELNPNPFLTEEVLKDLTSGNVKQVPWMTGIVQDEGLLIAASMLTVRSEIEDLNQNFNKTMIALLLLRRLGAHAQEAYNKIFDFYLHHAQLDKEDIRQVKGFIDVWSDRFFTYPLYKALKLQLSKGHKSIYLYNFEYSGQYSYAAAFSTEHYFRSSHPLGPSHCDDLLYQYQTPDIFNKLTKPNDLALVNIWLGLWTNFAIYGEPNPPENKLLNLNWDPLPTGDLHTGDTLFLNVTGSKDSGAKFNIWQGFYEERIAFWEQLVHSIKQPL